MRGDQRGKQYNSRDINKYKEAKDILGIFYNKEITKEKSIKKKTRYK